MYIFWILRKNNFSRALNLTGAVKIILLKSGTASAK